MPTPRASSRAVPAAGKPRRRTSERNLRGRAIAAHPFRVDGALRAASRRSRCVHTPRAQARWISSSGGTRMIPSHDPRRSPLRRLSWAALAGLALVGLAQCRSVSDQVSGLELGSLKTQSMRSRCVHDCTAEFREALLVEAARYRAAQRACGRDAACKRDQQRVHERHLKELMRDRLRCKRGCYDEGAGNTEALIARVMRGSRSRVTPPSLVRGRGSAGRVGSATRGQREDHSREHERRPGDAHGRDGLVA